MKIAIVTPYDYPYPGGVTEHVRHLDREFRARGHDTRIVAASSAAADELASNVIRVGDSIVPVTFNGATARITLSTRVDRRVQEILEDEKFDVVHVHEPAVPLLSLSVLGHSQALNVGTFHAYLEAQAVYEYAYPVMEFSFSRLDGRIFVSPALRDAVTRQFPGEYRVIPNGIDFARFASPEVRPIPEFDDGRPNILFVGRMEERKGFRHLFGAFPAIQRAVPGARLLVVGAFGPEQVAPFAEAARGDRIRDVHFVGPATREDLPRYYRTATVFCAPSTGSESFGIVLLEAMAAGAPVVASGIAGYRSVMTDGAEGRLVEPGDERGLAEAVVDLLSDRDGRARMAAQGRATAAEYDWGRVAPRVLEYYAELVEARARRESSPAPAGAHNPAGEAPAVVLRIRGGLRLEGRDRPGIVVSGGSAGPLEVNEEGGRVVVTGGRREDEHAVYVPRRSSVYVQDVDKDLRVQGLAGKLDCRRVAGHCELVDAGTAHFQWVGGHLSARRLAGSLESHVGGNLRVEAVEGHLTATVVGNADARAVRGGVTLHSLGHARVELSGLPGGSGEAASAITAGGNLHCVIRRPADAALTIDDGRGIRTVTVGAGGPEITLKARGRVTLDVS